MSNPINLFSVVEWNRETFNLVSIVVEWDQDTCVEPVFDLGATPASIVHPESEDSESSLLHSELVPSLEDVTSEDTCSAIRSVLRRYESVQIHTYLLQNKMLVESLHHLKSYPALCVFLTTPIILLLHFIVYSGMSNKECASCFPEFVGTRGILGLEFEIQARDALLLFKLIQLRDWTASVIGDKRHLKRCFSGSSTRRWER